MLESDPTIFEDFRKIVLEGDQELVKAIWTRFPNHVWTCASGHLFEELSYKRMYDMLELFIENRKLCGGGVAFAEQYREDPEKWKSIYSH